MNANSAKVQSIIETTFVSAIDRIRENGASNLINDLYVQVDTDSGELQIYDEHEDQIGKVVIFDWMNKKDREDSLLKQISATLKAVLTVLSSKGLFDDHPFIKPFSVSLTDDSFTVIEELLFLDDDLFRLDDPLLKDLDKELDTFLNDLLSDV